MPIWLRACLWGLFSPFIEAWSQKPKSFDLVQQLDTYAIRGNTVWCQNKSNQDTDLLQMWWCAIWSLTTVRSHAECDITSCLKEKFGRKRNRFLEGGTATVLGWCGRRHSNGTWLIWENSYRQSVLYTLVRITKTCARAETLGIHRTHFLITVHFQRTDRSIVQCCQLVYIYQILQFWHIFKLLCI